MNETFIRTMPEGFGGLAWKDVTTIHPLGLTAVIILGVAMLLPAAAVGGFADDHHRLLYLLGAENRNF